MTPKEKEQLELLISISKDLILSVIGNDLINRSSEAKLIDKLEALDELDSEER